MIQTVVNLIFFEYLSRARVTKRFQLLFSKEKADAHVV